MDIFLSVPAKLFFVNTHFIFSRFFWILDLYIGENLNKAIFWVVFSYPLNITFRENFI